MFNANTHHNPFVQANINKRVSLYFDSHLKAACRWIHGRNILAVVDVLNLELGHLIPDQAMNKKRSIQYSISSVSCLTFVSFVATVEQGSVSLLSLPLSSSR